MNAISQLSPVFESTNVRIVQDADQLWFAAQDVMDCLDYSSSYKPATALGHVPEEWKGVYPIHTLGGRQKLLCLSEPGLYFFLGRSDKPKALPFQKWLAGEVLPSIRKTGRYSVQPAPATPCLGGADCRHAGADGRWAVESGPLGHEHQRARRIRSSVHVKPMPLDAIMAAPEDWPRLIAEPNGNYFSKETLTLIMNACLNKLL